MASKSESLSESHSKLAKNMEELIYSFSLERFLTLCDQLERKTESEFSNIDFEKKVEDLESELNKEKKELREVKTHVKCLKDEILEVTNEKNNINMLKSTKLNHKQELEYKIKTLSSIKLSSSDEQKINDISKHYKIHRDSVKVKWDYAASNSDTISGYVFNDNCQFEWFSVPQKDVTQEEIIEKMWSLISKLSDWNDITE